MRAVIDVEQKVLVFRYGDDDEFLIRIGNELPESWKRVWYFRHRDFVRKRKLMKKNIHYRPLWSPIQMYFDKAWRLRMPFQFTFNLTRMREERAREKQAHEDLVEAYLAEAERYRERMGHK